MMSGASIPSPWNGIKSPQQVISLHIDLTAPCTTIKITNDSSSSAEEVPTNKDSIPSIFSTGKTNNGSKSTRKVTNLLPGPEPIIPQNSSIPISSSMEAKESQIWMISGSITSSP